MRRVSESEAAQRRCNKPFFANVALLASEIGMARNEVCLTKREGAKNGNAVRPSGKWSPVRNQAALSVEANEEGAGANGIHDVRERE